MAERILLLLFVSLQSLRTDFRSVDVALGIHCNAFRPAGAGGLFHGIGNERDYLSVFDAAVTNAAFPPIMVPGNGLGFGGAHIKHVLLVDENSARPAELAQLGNKFAVLIEDLNSIVVAVAHEQPTLGIE